MLQSLTVPENVLVRTGDGVSGLSQAAQRNKIMYACCSRREQRRRSESRTIRSPRQTVLLPASVLVTLIGALDGEETLKTSDVEGKGLPVEVGSNKDEEGEPQGWRTRWTVRSEMPEADALNW